MQQDTVSKYNVTDSEPDGKEVIYKITTQRISYGRCENKFS
jgi:hypothetical protein